MNINGERALATIRTVAAKSWARRLLDGRTLVISIVDSDILPCGTNDVVMQSQIDVGEIRDETAAGRGKSWIDIVEDVFQLTKWYDYGTEALLASFRVNRDILRRSLLVNKSIAVEAEELAQRISERSDELRGIMDREMCQLRRVLYGKVGEP